MNLHRSILGIVAIALFTTATLAQTNTHKGKTYEEAKVVGFDSRQRLYEGTSHNIRTYYIQSKGNIYSVERHAFTNGDLMKVTPGDTIYVLPDGEKMSILVNGKESKYVIVGIKPAE
jgi:hypothetical protein